MGQLVVRDLQATDVVRDVQVNSGPLAVGLVLNPRGPHFYRGVIEHEDGTVTVVVDAPREFVEPDQP